MSERIDAHGKMTAALHPVALSVCCRECRRYLGKTHLPADPERRAERVAETKRALCARCQDQQARLAR